MKDYSSAADHPEAAAEPEDYIVIMKTEEQMLDYEAPPDSVRILIKNKQ